MLYKEWLENNSLKIFCQCGCNQEIIIQKHHKYYGIPEYIRGHKHPTKETIEKIRKSTNGKIISEETKQKQREKMLGRYNGINNPNFGKKHTEEELRKMRENRPNQSGKNHPKYGTHCSEETKQKIRENKPNQFGENNPNYIDGRSFQPYCYKFNEKKKEEIGNRDNRICQECYKTELNNGCKLDVHHIHYDKENCYPDLIALCHICNSKANKNRDYWEEHFMVKLKERNL